MGNIFVKCSFSLVILCLLAFLYVTFSLAPRTDEKMNAVTAHDPYIITEKTQKLHEGLRVADLHADTLLWARNPAKRHQRGQTDLPRLREGSVTLQVFTAVTKTPSGLNYESNTATSDDITKLAIAQRWPIRTWFSIFERARYQAKRLEKIAKQDNSLFIIRSQNDLRHALQQKETTP